MLAETDFHAGGSDLDNQIFLHRCRSPQPPILLISPEKRDLTLARSGILSNSYPGMT